MSKEIKFRAWLKNKKEMVDVALINYATKCITYALTKKGSMLTIIDENFSNIELFQYIGLKDKKNAVKYLELAREGADNVADEFIDEYEEELDKLEDMIDEL